MLDTRDAEISSLTAGNYLGGLLSLPELTAEHRTQRISEIVEEAWAARRAHPVYRQLRRDPNFVAAWKVFERAQKNTDIKKLASPTAPFSFLREFVERAGSVYEFSSLVKVASQNKNQASQNKNRYGATAERRRRAAKRAVELRGLIAKGVRLEDYMDTRTLDSLLGRLVEELAAASRKKYGGKREFARNELKGLAFSLLARCGLRSPAVVSHFARMVNVPCDEKTAQRYCNEAANKWRLMLARALRDTDKKDGV
jgi:hypothetical protein